MTLLSFESLPCEAIPEVSSDDPRIPEYVGQLCGIGSQIPGIVLREADIRHTEGEMIDPKFGLNEGEVALGGCLSIMTVTRGSTPSAIPDVGWHRDPARNDVEAGQPVVNANTNVIGSSIVRIIVARPGVSEADLREYDSSVAFKSGRIDTGLFVPMLYTTRLYPRYTLFHRDDRGVHDFKTTAEPRIYTSGMYPKK